MIWICRCITFVAIKSMCMRELFKITSWFLESGEEQISFITQKFGCFTTLKVTSGLNFFFPWQTEDLSNIDDIFTFESSTVMLPTLVASSQMTLKCLNCSLLRTDLIKIL